MRIRSHILFWLLLLVVLPMVGAGLYLYRGNCVRLELAADQQLKAVGDRVISDVDAVVRRTLEGALLVAKNPLLAEFLMKRGKGVQAAEADIERFLYQSVIQDSFMVRSYALLDASGRKVVETNPELYGVDESARAWVVNCLKEALPVVEPDLGPGRGSLWVCAPIRNANAEVVGLLRLRYDMAVLQQVVGKYSGPLMRGRFALVSNAEGRVLVHGQRREMVGTLLAGGGAAPETGFSWVGGEQVGAADTGPYRLLVLKSKQAPWTILLLEPQAVHEETLEKLKELMLLLGGLALILLVASSVLVARISSAPIARLAQISRGIEAGNLSVFEEQGPAEVRVLAHSFNEMTKRLRTTLGDLEGKMEELRKSERLLDAYIDASPVAMAVADSSGRFIHLNRMFTQLFGYTEAELKDVEGWWEKAYPDPEYRKAISTEWTLRLQEAQATDGAVRPLEGRVCCKDGSYRQIEFHARTICGSVLALCSDLTERTRTAEATRRIEDQLRQVQKLEAVGAMAGGVAHDFNNILLALLGNAQLAYEDLEEGHPSKESLREVLEAGGRARELVARLLTFTRKVEMQPKPVKLGPVLEEAAKLLKVSIPASVRLEVAISEQVPEVLCDPEQIHRIVSGLVSNAVYAMREHGGVLRVALEQVQPSEEELGHIPGLKPSHTVRIQISDTGEGMGADTMSHLFEPFFTMKPMGEGTGLGLASAREVLRAFGGVVSVVSTLGEGSCFTVHLPGAEQARVKRSAEAEPVVKEVRGGAVAIVDDDELVRSMLERMVQRMGYEVSAFGDGTSLLQRLRVQPEAFSVVISDLSMPGMTGLELAVEIGKLCPKVAVVLATGNSSRLEKEQLAACGVSELVDKPFSRERLAAVIARFVG